MNPRRIIVPIALGLTTAWACLPGRLDPGEQWSGREYHVSVDGDDDADGSDSSPLRTISAAARLAGAGDVVTVRGFTMMHAATPWAPPTAEQIGLIGTHWSGGWIIEDNDVSYSTCVGITLGKYGDQWDNTSQDTAEGYVETIRRTRPKWRACATSKAATADSSTTSFWATTA